MKKLEWDSNFFKTDIFLLNNRDELLSLPKGSKAYLFLNVQDPSLSDSLFDKKVTYELNILPKEGNLNIPSQNFNVEEILQINELFIASSKYSRYRLDTDFPNEYVDEMYKIWAEKSIENSSSKIFYKKNESGIVGLVVVRIDKDFARIEIVAVSQKCRGLGIAKDLIKEVIMYLEVLRKISRCEVVTQLDNLPACRLYEKAGFKVKDIKYVYHFHC